MKKYLNAKTASILAMVTLLAYTCIGFFLVPYVGKKMMIATLHDTLGLTAGMDALSFNPYTLESRLENFFISDRSNAPLFKIQKLYLNLSISSLFRLAPVVTQLTLDGPEFFLTLNEDGQLNLSEMTDNPSPPSKEEEALKNTPFQFRLSNTQIKNGAFHFSDKIRNQTLAVDHLNLDLPLLSAMGHERRDQALPEIGFDLNGAPVQIKAATLPFDSSLNTQIEVKISDLDLTPFVTYLNLPNGVKMVSPGHLSLTLSGDYRLDVEQANGSSAHTLKANAKLDLKGLDIQTRESAPLFSCPQFTVEADSPNLFSREIFIRHLGIINSRLNLERDETGQLTLTDLVPTDENQESPPQDASDPGFHIHLVQGGLDQGTLVFTDKSVAPVFTTTLSDFDIILADLDIHPGSLTGHYETGLLTEAGETLSAKGQLSIDPSLDIEGRIELNGIRPEKYRPYYSPYGGRNLNIGKTDIGVGFKFAMDGEKPVFSLDEGGISLRSICIQGEEDRSPVLEMNGLGLTGIQMNSTAHRIRIGQVNAGSGQMALIRNKKGDLNLVQRLSEMMVSPASPDDPSPDSPDSSESSAPPWKFELGRFRLENYHLNFSDAMPEDPVELTVSNIMISADDLATFGDKGKVKAAMDFEDTGKISISGDLELSGPSAVLDLDLEQIQVPSFGPYFTEYLNLRIPKGHIGTQGRLFISFPDQQPPQIKFTGQATLNEFISKTKTDDTDFFKCKSLYLSGMDISTAPVQVNVGKIALTDFYQKILISKSGQVNLNTIMVEKPKDELTPQAAGTSAPGPRINIPIITLQGGHLNFSDTHTRPGFAANMTDIGGSLTGLSSMAGTEPAEVHLKGTHGGHAPLDISGKIDPLKPDPFADLSISFKNIELPEFNVYTGKYLGYYIEKGKLLLDLKYKIQDGKLNSSNQIFFDQLSLGNTVDSPDATSLPVQLAISLLKNSRGDIELDVPIQGDLNDPEFSYGRLVLTTFTNLILGVVTAPFKFIGAIVGIGEDTDLGYVDFAPGSDILDEENKAKIDILIRVLAEKKKLNLEINGRFNSVKDGEKLREQKYQALLISLLPGEDELKEERFDTLSTEQRDDLVGLAYAQAQFPKPRDKSGKEKEISLEEMEKLVITAQKVDESELKALSQSRSNRIRDYIVDSGKVAPARIFITKPDPIDNEDESGFRVKTRFALK